MSTFSLLANTAVVSSGGSGERLPPDPGSGALAHSRTLRVRRVVALLVVVQQHPRAHPNSTWVEVVKSGGDVEWSGEASRISDRFGCIFRYRRVPHLAAKVIVQVSPLGTRQARRSTAAAARRDVWRRGLGLEEAGGARVSKAARHNGDLHL